ncbi:MAG: sulfatase-like hydrolase/transferase [Planctomycetota bacterium]
MQIPLALLLGASPIAAQDPPAVLVPNNVIVIVADDVGVDMIGAYDDLYANHPDPDYPNTTPAINYLAETGILFTNCWSNPACSPTRAQLLTGRHALHSGIGKIVNPNVVTDGMGLQQDIPTIPSMLRNASLPFPYHSAALGKWHLADGERHPPAPGLPPHPLGSDTVDWFDQYAGSMHNLGGIQTYNKWTKTFATTIAPGTDECVPPAGSFCEAIVIDYATEDTADDAILLSEKLQEPYFLYVAFNAAHTPLDAPLEDLTPASCFGIQGEVDCKTTDGNDIPKDTRCLAQWLDNEIGRLICSLESPDSEIQFPTTVVFIGDNGTRRAAAVGPFADTPGKGSVYQAGINVPFIIKSDFTPPTARGSVNDALVCATDFLASMSSLSGAALPDDPFGLLESVSFAPYIFGAQGSLRDFVYAENFKQNFDPTDDGQPPVGYELDKHRRAIRDVAGYKLHQRVERSDCGGGMMSGDCELTIVEELYFLVDDPHEQNDIIALKDQPPVKDHYDYLRGLLDTKFPHLVTE